MFAVIDIETTGGRTEKDKITEIAILVHDGKEVIKKFSSLINPRCRIPPEITRLTGITNEMVADAPQFHEVAKQIIEFTENSIFVAHNVRFDYGFIKAAFKDLGYNYQRKTLCTVRLSRATFPGLPSYSLGKLCDSLDIRIENRHRAMGDAEATAILLGKIFAEGQSAEPGWLAAETKKTAIPPLLKPGAFESIPESTTGVYYFYDRHGHVIYVGKSTDIRKRMVQHFALSAKDGKRAIQLKNEIADISYEATGSELVALLLESDEIKKIKPLYNVAQKRVQSIPFFGIFQEYDEFGYIKFQIRKLKDGDEPLSTADNMYSARKTLYRMIEKYQLCLSKCDQHNMSGPCFDYHLHKCQGACVGKEGFETYNPRAIDAQKQFGFHSESFLLVGKGRHENEKSVVCLERGQYKGFGYIDVSVTEPCVHEMRSSIKSYSHNRDIQQILCTHLKKDHVKLAYNMNELFSETSSAS